MDFYFNYLDLVKTYLVGSKIAFGLFATYLAYWLWKTKEVEN